MVRNHKFFTMTLTFGVIFILCIAGAVLFPKAAFWIMAGGNAPAHGPVLPLHLGSV